MPCSRRRRDVSQTEDYNIFKLVFRWEVHIATKACQEQGISFLLVIMETIRGLHTVAKEHIQGIVAALLVIKAKESMWWSLSWRNFKSFEKCCLLLWLTSGYLTVTELNHLLYHHLFSDALMTSKMSTNPLNSFFFDFMKFSDGLHNLHGKEGDLLFFFYKNAWKKARIIGRAKDAHTSYKKPTRQSSSKTKWAALQPERSGRERI